MPYEHLGFRTIGCNHVEDALGQADFLYDLGHDIGFTRSLRGGLQDEGAARQQCRRKLLRHEGRRCVPWDDRADNADRFPNQQTDAWPGVKYVPFFKRSEEHTSELQSLMRISYAVFCLKKKKKTHTGLDQSEKVSRQLRQHITDCETRENKGQL